MNTTSGRSAASSRSRDRARYGHARRPISPIPTGRVSDTGKAFCPFAPAPDRRGPRRPAPGRRKLGVVSARRPAARPAASRAPADAWPDAAPGARPPGSRGKVRRDDEGGASSSGRCGLMRGSCYPRMQATLRCSTSQLNRSCPSLKAAARAIARFSSVARRASMAWASEAGLSAAYSVISRRRLPRRWRDGLRCRKPLSGCRPAGR